MSNKKKKPQETIEIAGYTFIVRYAYRANGANLLARSQYTQGHNLYDVYKRPSYAKRDAWDDCRRMCREMGGTNFRITGHNCMEFSVAFEIVHEGAPARVVITHLYNYIIFG